MSYTTLEMFPDFRVEDISPILLLSFGQPTLGQARKHPNTYLESRKVRPLRIEPALHSQIIDRTELYGRPLGAYAKVCQSTAYPKLTAFIEAEVSPTALGWMLNARARHGNQDCVGGNIPASGGAPPSSKSRCGRKPPLVPGLSHSCRLSTTFG